MKCEECKNNTGTDTYPCKYCVGKDRFEPISKPLYGQWRHNNGIVCCGTLRIFKVDIDTDPNENFKKELLDWVVDTLNK